MFDKSQLMRGTLEGCILKIIDLKTTYGYEIVMQLEELGFTEVKEGTIYPILVRLEKKNMVRSEYCSSPLGPIRKYYYLTQEGTALLQDFKTVWGQVSNTVNRILELEEKGDEE